MEASEQKAVAAASSVPDAQETSFGSEAQIEYVPYGRLCRSPLNVRQKAPTGIEALAGTIAGKGLIQINRNLSSCYIAITASHRSAGSHLPCRAGPYR